jgi:phospholipid/cholesterol/gamma-HCH transport system permease protein
LPARQSAASLPAPPAALVAPLAWVGRWTLAGIVDLGRMATLLGQAARSIVRPADEAPPYLRALARQLAGLLVMGMALVGLACFGMGSFLALQAYYGGTFVDGTGAVVGVGMIRNAAPMLAGLIMAGLVAARTTSELRIGDWAALDRDPLWIQDRDVTPEISRLARSRLRPEPGRLAAVRIGAGVVAGAVLSLWGAVVGTVVGWKVAQTMLGVSTHGYFSMMIEMLWLRDVVGLLAKGVLYGLFAALCACHEGLRQPPDPESDAEGRRAARLDLDAVAWAAFRAACLASVAILVINSGWFLLFYHAGPAFGPTLLEPQGN